MTTDAPSMAQLDRPALLLRVWALHLISFAVPLYTLAFVTIGSHRGLGALPWLMVVPVVWSFDRFSGVARHPAASAGLEWAFDGILVALAFLQFLNIALGLRLVQQVGFFSWTTVVAVLLVGVGSGFSAIVVAHELVHRSQRGLFTLGRVLLGTVLYEHFATEHVRGHHARVGTNEDPATARFGESFETFWKRTVPGQLRSAWRLECKRLGDEAMTWRDPRILRSRVLHGLVAEGLLLLCILATTGPGALVFFAWQAAVAVRLLEAVNYFEHYGLRRTSKRVRPMDSWDSESRFTLFALVGLSRHADHHAHAAKPYQTLRTSEESPKLPFGYIVTTLMVIFSNRKLRRRLDRELERRRLGPFAEPSVPPAAELA